jgi:flagellar biosynthesis/type III secretory pathway protein FliH
VERVVVKAARGIGGVRILRGYSEGAAAPRFNAEQHHYKIEAIIAEAAKNLPSRDDVVIHVNPADEAALRENAAAIGELKDVRIAADQAVGCAGCVLETPKGIVESFVEQRLGQIGKALQESSK